MSHRVHGLAGEHAPPDWPPLTREEIATVLERYGLGTAHGAAWLSPRPLSAAALAETGSGRVFIKRHHHRVRNMDTLAEEHRFMAWLRERGIPVPPVHATPQGASALVIEAWVYEVHDAARGSDIYRDSVSWTPLRNLDHARAAGAMLANLHLASEGYAAPQRNTHILVARDELLRANDPVATLERQLPQRPGLADYLAKRPWREDVARRLVPGGHARVAAMARQARTWTHNDWHVSNLCWDADGAVAAVLDFGLASPTCALFDLATAIERNAIDWLALERGMDAVHVDTAQALIAGYRAIRPLDAADLDALATLLPRVHVDFALSEVEYFHAILGDTARADLAYDDFLLGHASWFDGAPGQALLSAVRAAR